METSSNVPTSAERVARALAERTPTRRGMMAMLSPLDAELLEHLERVLPPLSGDRFRDRRFVHLALAGVRARHDLALPIPPSYDAYLARDLELYENCDLAASEAALCCLPPERRDRLVLEALESPRNTRALFALSSVEDPDILRFALRSLDNLEDDRPHMPMFCYGLHRVGARIVPLLVETLGSRRSFGTRTMLAALGLFSQAEHAELFFDYIDAPDPGQRSAASIALCALGEGAREVLEAGLAGGGTARQRGAGFLLSLLEHEGAAPLRELTRRCAERQSLRAQLFELLEDERLDDAAGLVDQEQDSSAALCFATEWYIRGDHNACRQTWEQMARRTSGDALSAWSVTWTLLRRPAPSPHVQIATWFHRVFETNAVAPLVWLVNAPHRPDRAHVFEFLCGRSRETPRHALELGSRDPDPRISTMCLNALRYR